MKETLKQLLYECVSAGKEGEVDPSRYPSQVHTHKSHFHYTRYIVFEMFTDIWLEMMFYVAYIYHTVLKSNSFRYISGSPPPQLCRCWNGAHFPTVACKGGGDLIKSPLLIF